MKLTILVLSALLLTGCYTNRYEMKQTSILSLTNKSVKIRIAKVSLKEIINGDTQSEFSNTKTKATSFFKSLNIREINNLACRRYPQIFSTADDAIPCEVDITVNDKVSAHSSMWLYFLTMGILPGGWENKQTFSFNSKLDFNSTPYTLEQTNSEIKGLWLVSVWTPSALVNVGNDKENEVSFAGAWGFFAADNNDTKKFFTKLLIQTIASQMKNTDDRKLQSHYLESI